MNFEVLVDRKSLPGWGFGEVVRVTVSDQFVQSVGCEARWRRRRRISGVVFRYPRRGVSGRVPAMRIL
jgi:hypothetical protein